MICANAVQSPDGLIVVLNPSETNVGTCQYVLQTGAEAANGSLWSMSPEDGALLAGYVCLLWAAAWCIKQVAHVLKENPHVEND